MRMLTFNGFLSHYIKYLSFEGSQDIVKLAEEAVSPNPRLRAPLVLYALASGKSGRLKSALKASGGGSEMLDALQRLSGGNLEQRLDDGSVPEEYRKVWSSFLVACDAPKRDEELKASMRQKILRLQAERKCSNYRIYTDLKLNPGNINSWLKNGNSAKVSYKTAERIMDYLLND